MEKPRTIIKKYTIPILFNYQDSKLWIITGCGKVSKIAIPKNECYPDQKRCIPLVKVYLRDYLVMDIVTLSVAVFPAASDTVNVTTSVLDPKL